MYAKVKGVPFIEVSSVQECPYREGFHSNIRTHEIVLASNFCGVEAPSTANCTSDTIL